MVLGQSRKRLTVKRRREGPENLAYERGDRSVDLVEQGTDLRAIIGIPVGQHRRDDLPGVGIHTEV